MSSFDPPFYAIRDVVTRALAEDLGVLGDLTAVLVPPDAHAMAEIVARHDGVLAGAASATEVFRQIDPDVTVSWSVTDSERVNRGAAAARIEGNLRSILTAERTALNFLCHLSGIASATRGFVDAVSACGTAKIWDTRKTLPGLRALEKAAVRAGGGVNHRGSLSDMVLVKDNHLAGLGIMEAVARARAHWPGRGVEVECERLDQVREAATARADLVMLDNMTPDQVAEAVAIVRAGAPAILVEVSGGVTLDTVAAYAAAGVDLISTSAITQSAPALDLGLDVTSVVEP